MRRLMQQRVITCDVQGVVFHLAAPPIGFEARCMEAVPDPSPPTIKGVYETGRDGKRVLVGGRAVPVCDPSDGRFKAEAFRAQQRRCGLWIAASLAAAGSRNAHLLAPGEQHLFGALSGPCTCDRDADRCTAVPARASLDLSVAFADGVLHELTRGGVADGDLVRLVEAYQRAIGQLTDDVEEAEKNSPATSSSSASS